MEERSINNRSAKRATFFEKRFRFSSREQFERNLSWARFIQDKIAGVISTCVQCWYRNWREAFIF